MEAADKWSGSFKKKGGRRVAFTRQDPSFDSFKHKDIVGKVPHAYPKYSIKRQRSGAYQSGKALAGKKPEKTEYEHGGGLTVEGVTEKKLNGGHAARKTPDSSRGKVGTP